MIGLVLAIAVAAAEVQVDPCLGVAEAEVRRLTRLELGRSGPSAPIHASVECVKGGALVRVDDPVTRKSLARTIELKQVTSKTMARYLALAIAELVEASWAELTLPTPRVVEPLGEAPASEQRSAAAEQVRVAGPVRLEAFGVARRVFTTNLWQFGGGARILVSGPLVGGLLEVEGAHGLRPTALGTVAVDSATVALLVTLTAPSLGPVTVSGAVGARGGVGLVTGTPFDPARSSGASLLAPWIGPCGALRGIATWRSWFISLGVESGLTVVGVEGTVAGAPGPGLIGGWLGLSLGLGARP